MRLLPTALISVALTCLTLPMLSYAKTPAPHAAGHQQPDELKRFEAAAAKLDLSAEQKSKVARLVQEVRASANKIDAAPGNPAQKQERLRALRTGAKEKLDHILTVAQDRKLKTLLGAGKPATGSAIAPKK